MSCIEKLLATCIISMLLSADASIVINADNEMITERAIGWIIWIYQIIKGTTNRSNYGS